MCLDVQSTQSLLWLRLAEPMFYLVLWFFILYLNWLYHTRKEEKRKYRLFNNYEFSNHLTERLVVADKHARRSEMKRSLSAGSGVEPEVAALAATSSATEGVEPAGPNDDDNQRVQETTLLAAETTATVAEADGRQNRSTTATSVGTLSSSWQEATGEEEPLPDRRRRLLRQFRFIRALEFLMLLSYETLTEQALQLLNCIGVGSCGRVLAEYPDVHCTGNSDYYGLRVVAILIMIYSFVFPLGLFYGMRRINRNRNNWLVKTVKYGVFFDHFKSRYYWWEVQVR
jgi:hypothetical protein